MEVSVYRAEPTTWLDVFAALSPFLGALLAIGGVIATIIFHNRRERDRQKHERLLKNAELEAARVARQRDERIAAYRKLLAATATAHTDREGVKAISAAYAEISLLASTDEIDQAAHKVWATYDRAQRIYAKTRDKERATRTPTSVYAQNRKRAEAAGDEFLVLAWEELGVKGRSAGFHDLEGADAGDELPDPETFLKQEPAKRRPWWQRMFRG